MEPRADCEQVVHLPCNGLLARLCQQDLGGSPWKEHSLSKAKEEALFGGRERREITLIVDAFEDRVPRQRPLTPFI